MVAKRQQLDVGREIGAHLVWPDLARQVVSGDQRAGDCKTTAGHALAHRVYHDVGAVTQRAHQRRRGHGGVDDQRDRALMRQVGHGRNVENGQAGVGRHLAEDETGGVVNLVRPLGQVQRVAHPTDLDPALSA